MYHHNRTIIHVTAVQTDTHFFRFLLFCEQRQVTDETFRENVFNIFAPAKAFSDTGSTL